MASRRHAVLAVAVTLLVAGWVLWRWGRTATALLPSSGALAGRAEGFNVLLITLDTLRADRLGFSHVAAPAPLTLPSHATVHTGLMVPHHGVYNNGTFELAAEHDTLAEILASRGYRCAAFIGAFVLDRRYGLAQGFQHYDDDCNPTGEVPVGMEFNQRRAADVTSAALNWLDRGAGSAAPLMLWVHYFDAHHPYEPPEPYAAQFAGRPYDGEIAYIDAEVGRLLEGLGRRGLLERTLVVLCADHGEGLGEHTEATHSYLIYDSTMRVPLIFSAPAIFQAPIVVEDRLASLADVLPTVLGLLGLSAPRQLDGLDLFTAPADPGRTVYLQTMAPLLNNGWAPLHGLRRLQDKFILAPRGEYFDLSADPGELHNLEGRSPQAAMLRSSLVQMLGGWPDAAAIQQAARRLGAGEQARLAALGYAGAQPLVDPLRAPDPKDMMKHWDQIMRAEALSEAGQHQQALALIEPVLEADPGNGRAWTIAGLINRRLERPGRAAECMDRAVRVSPTADGYVLLAQLLLASGDGGAAFDEALAGAARLDPRHGGIFLARGDRLALQGRFDQALREFEQALAQDPVRFGAVARDKISQARRILGSGP
jgi:tetratricopeptide (TPR) repeat protein